MKRQVSKVLAAVAVLVFGYTLNAFELSIDDGYLMGFTGDVPANLVIPDTVTVIGDGVFCAEVGDMSALVSVSIPTSVVYIGESAFAGCSNLEEVVFAAKEAELVEYSWTDEHSVVHNDTYFGFAEPLEIGAYAFAGCEALTWIDIPAHASCVGAYAFSGCTALETVDFLADDTVTDSYLDVGDCAFDGCEALETVSFEDRPYDPDNNVLNAIQIYASAFEGCAALTELYLGEGVVEIGESAFSGIGIEDLEIPSSCGYIGDQAFAYCENLADVYFAGYDVYGTAYELDMDVGSAFEGTPWLDEIVYTYSYSDNGDGTVTLVGYDDHGSYIDTPITPAPSGDLSIPSEIDGKTVVAIGDYYFRYGLTSITIPASVTNISAYAVNSASSLTNITVAAENPAYKSVDGILYTKDGKTLLKCPGGKDGNIVVEPGTERIVAAAFYNNYQLVIA